MNTYARLPVTFQSWPGLQDYRYRRQGILGRPVRYRRLGTGSCLAHPRLVAAIAAQAGRMLHTSNLYRIAEQEQLADKLCALSGMSEVFGNSGAGANRPRSS